MIDQKLYTKYKLEGNITTSHPARIMFPFPFPPAAVVVVEFMLVCGIPLVLRLKVSRLVSPDRLTAFVASELTSPTGSLWWERRMMAGAPHLSACTAPRGLTLSRCLLNWDWSQQWKSHFWALCYTKRLAVSFLLFLSCDIYFFLLCESLGACYRFSIYLFISPDERPMTGSCRANAQWPLEPVYL